MDEPKGHLEVAAVSPETSEVSSALPQARTRRHNPSLVFLRCTKMAFRLTSYVTAPIVGLSLLFSLVFLAFSAGAGHALRLVTDWNGLKILFFPFALYFFLVLFGCFYGGLIGTAAGLLVWMFPRWQTPRWWIAANRPLRLTRLRRDEGTLAPHARRHRIWPWIVGVPLILLMVTAFGTAVYLKRGVQYRLGQAIALADRDNPQWRLQDLLAHRETVPEDENSADEVDRALTLVAENWPWPPAQPRGSPRLGPTPVSEAYEQITQNHYNVRLPNASADILRDELNTMGEGLEWARSVANYDHGSHEFELAPNPMDSIPRQTEATRILTRVLVADAAIRAQDGDIDGALDSSRAILGVARSIGDEPFLYSQVLRMAIDSIALDSLRRTLGLGEPTDAALARFQELTLDEYSQPLLLNGVRGDRAALAELLRRLGTGEVPVSVLQKHQWSDSPSINVPKIVATPPLQLWFDCQAAYALDWMNQAAAIARGPAHEWDARFTAWEAQLAQVRNSRLGPYTATIPLALIPGIRTAGRSQARCRAELGAAAIIVAAERHRRRRGDWPASISAIDHEILPHPPVDPFTGRSFIMERQGAQLLVHSVGLNQKDEHGDFHRKRWLTGGPDDSGARACDPSFRGLSAPGDPPKSAADDWIVLQDERRVGRDTGNRQRPDRLRNRAGCSTLDRRFASVRHRPLMKRNHVRDGQRDVAVILDHAGVDQERARVADRIAE